jgi:hypothetical protein
MTYVQHLKKELYALLFVMPIIIIAVAFTVYYSNSPQVSEPSYWLRFLALCIILFLCAEYLKYIYIQKTRSPFKERLRAAIRKSNTIISEFTKSHDASDARSKTIGMRYLQLIKENLIRFSLFLGAGLITAFIFRNKDFYSSIANKTSFIVLAFVYIILGPAITLLKEKYNQD